MAWLVVCASTILTGSEGFANQARTAEAKKSWLVNINLNLAWATAVPFLELPLSVLRPKYPWHSNIVTTIFWIGESSSARNPVPNRKSSWDARWVKNYGGTDSPKRENRTSNYAPKGFIPRQNPFYVALPYNDITSKGHKPEASQIIPWFRTDFQNSKQSVCKGRWVAIRRGGRVCYAQWEDCGPFRTDHSSYVFGSERPRANLNRGAGLDVSPAVRDYLGMDGSDVTDWKFVDFAAVPRGPWALFGDNNPFVNRESKNSN